MILKAPKIPLNIWFFVIGAICSVCIRTISMPMITSAGNSYHHSLRDISSVLISSGQLEAGNDIYLNSKDIEMLAIRLSDISEKIVELKEVNK